MDFSAFWERHRFMYDDRLDALATYVLRTGQLPNHKHKEITMTIKADTSKLDQAMRKLHNQLKPGNPTRDALASAIAEGASELAISGPKICLKDRYRHFYEVHLDGERVEVDGSSLPDGFSYLLESELDYAERLVIDHLATLTEGRIGKLVAEIAGQSDSRPLPSDSRVFFKVYAGTEVGHVTYHPKTRDFTIAILRDLVPGDGYSYTKHDLPPQRYSTLQEATETLLRAAA